jgi:DNA-binding protein
MTSLRERMIEDMQIHNLAVDTQNTYESRGRTSPEWDFRN